jgi:hypothetical protein
MLFSLTKHSYLSYPLMLGRKSLVDLSCRLLFYCTARQLLLMENIQFFLAKNTFWKNKQGKLKICLQIWRF